MDLDSYPITINQDGITAMDLDSYPITINQGGGTVIEMTQQQSQEEEEEQADDDTPLLLYSTPTISSPSFHQPSHSCCYQKIHANLPCCIMSVVFLFFCFSIIAIISRQIIQQQLIKITQGVFRADFHQNLSSPTPYPQYVLNSGPLISLFQPLEVSLLGTMFVDISDRNITLFMNILQGAHVVMINDHSEYYQRFKHMVHAYTRPSSHYSKVQQYAIPQGTILTTLLTGTTASNETWFQFEGASWDPFRHPMESLIHILNYVEYVLLNEQIGPLGMSKNTDKHPLKIQQKRFI